MAETYFSLSTTSNTSFCQVSGSFMQYFSFYGSKTIQKWSFLTQKRLKFMHENHNKIHGILTNGEMNLSKTTLQNKNNM